MHLLVLPFGIWGTHRCSVGRWCSRAHPPSLRWDLGLCPSPTAGFPQNQWSRASLQPPLSPALPKFGSSSAPLAGAATAAGSKAEPSTPRRCPCWGRGSHRVREPKCRAGQDRPGQAVNPSPGLGTADPKPKLWFCCPKECELRLTHPGIPACGFPREESGFWQAGYTGVPLWPQSLCGGRVLCPMEVLGGSLWVCRAEGGRQAVVSYSPIPLGSAFSRLSGAEPAPTGSAHLGKELQLLHVALGEGHGGAAGGLVEPDTLTLLPREPLDGTRAPQPHHGPGACPGKGEQP